MALSIVISYWSSNSVTIWIIFLCSPPLPSDSLFIMISYWSIICHPLTPFLMEIKIKIMIMISFVVRTEVRNGIWIEIETGYCKLPLLLVKYFYSCHYCDFDTYTMALFCHHLTHLNDADILLAHHLCYYLNNCFVPISYWSITSVTIWHTFWRRLILGLGLRLLFPFPDVLFQRIPCCDSCLTTGSVH